MSVPSWGMGRWICVVCSGLGCFPPRGDDLSGPWFPQLRDEYVLAFLHKDALTGLVTSSRGFKYKVLSEGQSQLEFAVEDERWEGRFGMEDAGAGAAPAAVPI